MTDEAGSNAAMDERADTATEKGPSASPTDDSGRAAANGTAATAKARIDAAMHRLEDALGIGGVPKDAAFLVIAAISLLASFFAPDALPFDPAWIAIVLCGVPIICEAIVGLVTEFDVKADVLVSLALVASVIIGEYFAAGEVAAIMQLGALLEDLTVAKARSGIEKLVALTPRTARIVSPATADASESERVVAAESVQVGDICRVLPGETVPVDGVIVSGETSIDESVMTGESMPADKRPGDEVRSGTVNRFGAFDMRAVRVGEDSSLSRMVRLVQSADAGKAKIVRLADRWATWIVVIALTAAAVTWAVTGEVIRAVTILVVFCPCALVLATPTAIMAAIGNVTKVGVLVREGDALERLASVRRVMFDKTGTLTHGRPQVVDVWATDGSDMAASEAYLLAAAAESRSEHPLGKAVVEGYRESRVARDTDAGGACLETASGRVEKPAAAPAEIGPALPPVEEFSMMPGRGVRARVAGRDVLVGNRELMGDFGIADPSPADALAIERRESEGCTVSLVAADGRLVGFVALADTVRDTAAETVAALHASGVSTTMATGDGPAAARHIAEHAGVEDVRASCLPEDKLAAIESFEAAGEPVCMVGDGVNDAPALKRAFVGVAMGGVGSDIAVDAADVVLVRDGIDALSHLFALARRMMLTIKCNIAFSLTLNFVAIALAITGLMGPVVGALVHNAGSVLVIANSALLLRWRAGRG